jgi:adenylylsulfate reductase, subunit B
MPPVINEKVCNCCYICVEHCPQDVFFGSKKKKIPIVTYPEECWHCYACVLDCKTENAIYIRTPIPQLLCYS